MAYGQIDPARLQGETLRRGYLRSPAEIEAERRKAADHTYNSFFTPKGAGPKTAPTERIDDDGSAGATGLAWTSVGDNRWRGVRPSVDDQLSRQMAVGAQGSPRLAAASSRGFWDYWGAPGCANCHGHTPDTLPPIGGGRSPFPPNVYPRSGDTNGSSGAGPGRQDRKQCEMQEANDRRVCSQQPTADAKAVCNATATDRRVHCDDTGEIGDPDLFTARRKSGRRWP